MNKKVSTILTLSLLLGGSLLSSSAFAQTIPFSQADDEKTYALKATAYWNGTDFTAQSKYVAYDAEEQCYYLTTDADKKVAFTIVPSLQGLNQVYAISSAYGPFSISNDEGKDGTNIYTAKLYDTNGDGSTDANDAEVLEWATSDVPLYQVASEKKDPNPVLFAHSGTDAYAALGFVLEEVAAGDVSDSQLNELFNTKGFNLDVKKDNADVDLAENLFGGESRIWAFQIRYATGASDNTIENSANVAWENETTKTGFIGYKVSEDGANGEDLIIPEGIYFFTDRVLKDGADPEALTAEDIDWVASTFIVVSPRETVETTVDNRSAGQGFKLVTAKGEEFIYEKNTSEFAVGDLPIYNACFNVKDNHAANDNYPYSIALKHFYYQKKAGDDMTVKADLAENMNLGVLEFDATEIQYLTTVPGSSREYIFKLSDSAAVDGIDLLNTDKTPAVYTIKFVAGNDADKELFGKYLTVGVNTDNNEVATSSTAPFTWVAKGSMISDETLPSFQYTITDVEDDKEVTFTNRETNESFTVKLFKEDGTDRYSFAFVDGKINVQPVNVKRNSYGVEKVGGLIDINEDVIVELKKVTPDEFAGFYNVDNESIRTIRFARDKNDTSYKWYAGVAKGTDGKYSLQYRNNDYFVEDVYEAAQWQLIKAEKPETIARTFVYNNTTTESIDDVINGDKVSAYRYILRYVNDGTPTEYFLDDKGGVVLENELNGTEFNAEKALEISNKDFKKFYIKENADGSVSLFGIGESFGNDGTDKKIVTKATKNTSIDATVDQATGTVSYLRDNTTPKRSAIYAYTSNDINLKTYLDGEAPNLSWEGEGHVTLQNNTAIAGDYITMNDDNEGILVDEASETFYLHETDKNAVVPSFYISLGKGEGSNALSERMFLFNPVDSVAYPVNMNYDPNYQLSSEDTKAIFKSAKLDASRDTLTTSVKGEIRKLAQDADNETTWAGLERFKFQIVETADLDGLYNIRQIAGSITREGNVPVLDNETVYLASSGQKLYFTKEKAYALALHIEGVEAPTANEGVSATEVKVIAVDGAINIKNAAGKNVVVSTILGQIVANEVLTSDNATISVPAGIAIVSVDGEEAVKVSVK